MATFKENLKQTFANFKTKYIGNVPEGVTVAQINQHLTEKAEIIIQTQTLTTSASGNVTITPPSGYVFISAMVTTINNLFLSSYSKFGGNYIVHVTDANGNAQGNMPLPFECVFAKIS